MGEEKPDAGEFIGDTVKIAYVDQAHSNINPDKSIWENCDGQELIMMEGVSQFSCVFKSFQLWRKRSKQKSFNTFWWR
jgi:ATPase subunit of ABC transporter with duplicated ATPase domains